MSMCVSTCEYWSPPPNPQFRATLFPFWIIKVRSSINVKNPLLFISHIVWAFFRLSGSGGHWSPLVPTGPHWSPLTPVRARRAQGLAEDAAVAQCWRMEVSDGGERTKEDRIGDSLVMEGEKAKKGETQVLQHHQLPERQNYSRDTGGKGGREGGREGGGEYDFGPDWSLQHDCLAFSQGIKRWQGQPENCVFQCWPVQCSHLEDKFLSSMQIYSAWLFSHECIYQGSKSRRHIGNIQVIYFFLPRWIFFSLQHMFMFRGISES